MKFELFIIEDGSNDDGKFTGTETTSVSPDLSNVRIRTLEPSLDDENDNDADEDM